MGLPEQIHVTYTEEDAQYLTVRPVMRQAFRPHELLDLIVRVTGKDPARVRHILRTGSVVYHYLRYRWEGIEADPAELDAALARFPDPDPARAFLPRECVAVFFLPRGVPFSPAAFGLALLGSSAVEFRREEALQKRIFARQSLWDLLMDFAARAPVEYAGYSYASEGDIFACELPPEEAAALARQGEPVAPRSLRPLLATILRASRVVFLCPRS